MKSRLAPTAILLHELVGFGEALRSAGIRAGPNEQIGALDAIEALGLQDDDSLYWALRASFVKHDDDIATFDRVYARYWTPSDSVAAVEIATSQPEPTVREVSLGSQERETSDATSVASTRRHGGSSERTTDDAVGVRHLAYSSDDVLARKSFREYAPADYRELAVALGRLAEIGPWRRGRRRHPQRRGSMDLRRTVRASLRTDGDALRPTRHRPLMVQRRLVVVCDVSGSMEKYARALLTFSHVATTSRRRVEVFAFATRLTRITTELLRRDPERAFRAAVDAVVDWSGGTRVGSSLDELELRHRGALHGAVVIIASDGWDLGDPNQLAASAESISRRARSLVWANPHLEDPQFEPLTRGMSAVLPYLDHLVPCHDLASLVRLVDTLDSL